MITKTSISIENIDVRFRSFLTDIRPKPNIHRIRWKGPKPNRNRIFGRALFWWYLFALYWNTLEWSHCPRFCDLARLISTASKKPVYYYFLQFEKNYRQLHLILMVFVWPILKYIRLKPVPWILWIVSSVSVNIDSG